MLFINLWLLFIVGLIRDFALVVVVFPSFFLQLFIVFFFKARSWILFFFCFLLLQPQPLLLPHLAGLELSPFLSLLLPLVEANILEKDQQLSPLSLSLLQFPASESSVGNLGLEKTLYPEIRGHVGGHERSKPNFWDFGS